MKEIKHLHPAGKAKFVDTGVTRASELLQNWNGQVVEGIGVIGAPLSKSSISHSGAFIAPETIRRSLYSYTTYAIQEDIDLKRDSVCDLGDIMMHVTDILESQKRIEIVIEEILQSQPLLIPIILGGDHSISCPAIKAFSKVKGRVGVIQFDAHLDVRNLEDGGPSNGTPFRGLLESGTLQGEELVQIGIRNFSNSRVYTSFAKEQGIRIYTMQDVVEKSIHQILDEAIKHLSPMVDSLYVSVDMDVLDQAFAPGCPAIGPGGMDSATLLQAIRYLASNKSVQGIDIVEIDPTLDFRDMTSRLAAHIMLNFMMYKQKGKSIE